MSDKLKLRLRCSFDRAGDDVARVPRQFIAQKEDVDALHISEFTIFRQHLKDEFTASASRRGDFKGEFTQRIVFNTTSKERRFRAIFRIGDHRELVRIILSDRALSVRWFTTLPAISGVNKATEKATPKSDIHRNHLLVKRISSRPAPPV